eukprot:gene1644-1985_t
MFQAGHELQLLESSRQERVLALKELLDVQELPQLQVLCLDGSDITCDNSGHCSHQQLDAPLAVLAHVRSGLPATLTVLAISRCGLTSLQGVQLLVQLKELYAASNQLSDLEPLQGLGGLQLLDVSHNVIEDADMLLYLAACRSLTSIKLYGNPWDSCSSSQTYKKKEPDLSDSQLDEDQAEWRENEHLFRLFVGWVPKLFTENDLLPLFQKYGDVKDIIILKDKMTGQPRGCAFVSYATKVEAEVAIQSLDKGVHLPGALCPMEVRYARSHQFVQAGSGPQDNRQLFFARAPLLITEPEIKQLFTQFGEVEEINLFRERRTHLSKGCGFVTMASREQAMAAMAALDEKQLLEGSATPLAVKWADPELQVKKRRAVEDSNAENRMLFFAKVLRSASEDEVRALFQQYGRVVEVNLFRAFQGAPTTKGCGLVTMGGNEEAAAAIDALDNRHIWEGMEAPMVVKWMDAALQKRRREEHLAAMRQGLVPSMSMSPDACTEEELRPVFESVGPVVELVVVRDKFTHESKGSAFVWYTTKADADKGIPGGNSGTGTAAAGGPGSGMVALTGVPAAAVGAVGGPLTAAGSGGLGAAAAAVSHGRPDQWFSRARPHTFRRLLKKHIDMVPDIARKRLQCLAVEALRDEPAPVVDSQLQGLS